MNQKQWQNYCSQYLVNATTDIDPAHQKFLIYKDSIEAIHINVLKISFPVVLKLLGETFFIRLCRDYIQYKQWQSYTLDHLGDDFDSFIHTSQLTQSISYLSEVAMIEWKVQLLAEKTNHHIDLGLQLQQLFETGEEFMLGLLPHINLIKSTQGGMAVWIAHQQESFESLDISNVETSYWYIENDGLEIKVRLTNKTNLQLTSAINTNHSVVDLCNELGVENIIQELIPLIENKSVFLKTVMYEEIQNVG